MKILDIAAKDIYVTIELSVHQIDCITDFITHSNIEYNSEEEPYLKSKLDYVIEVVLPVLKKVQDDIKRG